MAKRKYADPPVEEALCQFTFEDAPRWDIATPGRLFEHFKDRYPGQPVSRQMLQANLTPSPGESQPTLALAQSQRVQFADEAGHKRLTVGPDAIGVHRLAPYVGFEEELLPRIQQDVPEAVAVLGDELRFQAVTVRYINKFVFPAAEEIDLGEYFQGYFANPVPAEFDGTISAFFYKTSSEARSLPRLLNLTFASVEAPKDSAAFIFDIEITHKQQLDTDEAIALLTELKPLENSVFESFITEKSRELFQ